MPAVQYQLTLSATPKRLSDVYGGTPGVPDPAIDKPYRWLTLQTQTADAYLGVDNTVSATKYGVLLGDGSVSDATGHLGPFGSGVVRLSDFWAVSPGGAILHIFGLRF